MKDVSFMLAMGLLCALPASVCAYPSSELVATIAANMPANYELGVSELKSGLLAFEAGDYRSASDHLAHAAIQHTSSRDLAAYFLAESQFHAGHFAKAVAILKGFPKQFPASKWNDFAVSRLGDALRENGQLKDALAQHKKLIETCPDYPHPGALKMSVGMTLLELERLQEAANWFYRFTVEFPKNIYRGFADQKLKMLSRRGFRPQPINMDDSLEIARSLRLRRLHEDGLKWIRQLAKRPNLTKKQRWKVGYHEARMLLNSRQFRLAIDRFKSLEKNAMGRQWRLRTHKWRSRAYEGLGQVERAIAHQHQYWQGRDFLSPAQRAARGELYLRHGWFSQAADWFSNLTGGRSRRAKRLRVLKPIAEVSAGRSVKAKQSFEAFFRAGYGRDTALQYWSARINAVTNAKDRAIVAYRKLSLNHNSYYAEQSRARLRELGQDVTNLWQPAPNSTGQTESERFRRLFGNEMPKDVRNRRLLALLKIHRLAGESFVDIQKAFETAYVGREDDAVWHLRRVANELMALRSSPAWKVSRWSYMHKELLDFRKGPARGPWGDVRQRIRSQPSLKRSKALRKLKYNELSQALAYVFESMGDYHYVLKLLQIHGRPKAQGSKTRRELELYYPKAYREIVEREAKQYGLEPYVMWALMRTESHFNSLAVSPAEARGLMQVIWQTAQRISESGGFVDMGNAQILLPRVSIALGAYYMGALLEKFGQQKPLAFAAYNAGPHRVSSWLDRKPDMKMDQFIEEIQYEEARAYVKKVLESLLVYRRLYEGESKSWIPQSINRRYESEPDY